MSVPKRRYNLNAYVHYTWKANDGTLAQIRFTGKDEKSLIQYMNKWLSLPENKKWLAKYPCKGGKA